MTSSSFSRLGFLAVGAVLICTACEGSEHVEPSLAPRAHVHALTAGNAYRVAFSEPVDQHPTGETWDGTDLNGSPLAQMERSVLIIKADDFGGPISKAGAESVELTSRYGAVVSFGIITSRLEGNDEINSTYSELHDAGHESWFHGHSHDFTSPEAEFAGVSLGAQTSAIETGIEAGRAELGIEFHAFGAPGNATDRFTAEALAEFPQLVVWIFGRAESPALENKDVVVIPRLIEAEASTGVTRSPNAFEDDLLALLELKPIPVVVTLQIHPMSYGEDELIALESMLEAIVRTKSFRFSSPFDYWKWLEDRARISVTKSGQSAYDVDLSGAELDQHIDLGEVGEALESITLIEN